LTLDKGELSALRPDRFYLLKRPPAYSSCRNLSGSVGSVVKRKMCPWKLKKSGRQSVAWSPYRP